MGIDASDGMGLSPASIQHVGHEGDWVDTADYIHHIHHNSRESGGLHGTQ